jgi:hypothetical protein
MDVKYFEEPNIWLHSQKLTMAPQTIRSILGMPQSKPTLADSILVIIDAQNE